MNYSGTWNWIFTMISSTGHVLHSDKRSGSYTTPISQYHSGLIYWRPSTLGQCHKNPLYNTALCCPNPKP